jgi:undecaprenyl diphosphate synthase
MTLVDSPVRVPKHVAIIMDGNGRWATSRGWNRSMGHAQGCARVKGIIREADRLGVKYLTLYCFSTENWSRPAEEVSALMELLRDYLLQERQELMENNVKLETFGDISRIPDAIREILTETKTLLSKNTGMVLNFCLNYGGRAEILRSVQLLAEAVKAGKLEPSQITEEDISSGLYSAGIPDPDLIIRTSGEARISNFLLWQLAYSELYITETLWPDFEASHLQAALEAYGRRKRRFGQSDESELALQAKQEFPEVNA